MEKHIDIEFLDLMKRFHAVDTNSTLPELPRSEIKIIILLGQTAKKHLAPEEHYQMSEVAELMNVSGPAISKSIKHLEALELIYRINDPRDRRKSRLDLTDKGYKTYQIIEKNLDSVLSSVLKEMGEEKYNQLMVLLNEFVTVTEKEIDRLKKASAVKKGRKKIV